MIFLIDGKKYDTKKSELIYKSTWFNETSIFRTKKGNYFMVDTIFGMVVEKSVMSECEAKEFIKSRDWEQYEKVFGEIEEG